MKGLIFERLSDCFIIKNSEVLEFEGQTKGKLGTPDARNATENIVYSAITTYLEENKEIAYSIFERAQNAQKVREAARKAREEARTGKLKKKDVTLSGKLTQTKDKTKMSYFLLKVSLLEVR